MRFVFLIFIAMNLSTACSVELQDKDKMSPQDLFAERSELVVEREFLLPEAMIQSDMITLRYDRLILRHGAQFITRGGKVRIEVGELVADQAAIRSFKEGQKASPGRPGRSGGHLELVVGKASGKLVVEMRGEDGGDGKNGREPDEALRGAKGAKGTDALYVSNLGHGIGRVLVRRAQAGGPGMAGARGYPGENGSKGGDSGTLIISIAHQENFKLQTARVPGQGGRAGRGGAGGKGGLGGDPGRDRFIPNQTYAKAGPQGAEGPRGLDGVPGADGKLEKFCMKIGDSFSQCE